MRASRSQSYLARVMDHEHILSLNTLYDIMRVDIGEVDQPPYSRWSAIIDYHFIPALPLPHTHPADLHLCLHMKCNDPPVTFKGPHSS